MQTFIATTSIFGAACWKYSSKTLGSLENHWFLPVSQKYASVIPLNRTGSIDNWVEIKAIQYL